MAGKALEKLVSQTLKPKVSHNRQKKHLELTLASYLSLGSIPSGF